MKIKEDLVNQFFHRRLARRGKITPKRKRREVLWQWAENRKDIYITCPGCSAISKIRSPEVSRAMKVKNCVVCSNCGTHFYTVLEKWDGPIAAHCTGCGRNSKTSNRDGLPAGWRRSRTAWGSAVDTCPKCRPSGRRT